MTGRRAVRWRRPPRTVAVCACPLRPRTPRRGARRQAPSPRLVARGSGARQVLAAVEAAEAQSPLQVEMGCPQRRARVAAKAVAAAAALAARGRRRAGGGGARSDTAARIGREAPPPAPGSRKTTPTSRLWVPRIPPPPPKPHGPLPHARGRAQPPHQHAPRILLQPPPSRQSLNQPSSQAPRQPPQRAPP